LNKEDCKFWVTGFGSLQLHVASRNVKWGSDCNKFVLYCLFTSQCGVWIYKRLVLYMTFEYFNNLELKDTVFVNRADTSQKITLFFQQLQQLLPSFGYPFVAFQMAIRLPGYL